jgi:hypothetical protein
MAQSSRSMAAVGGQPRWDARRPAGVPGWLLLGSRTGHEPAPAGSLRQQRVRAAALETARRGSRHMRTIIFIVVAGAVLIGAIALGMKFFTTSVHEEEDEKGWKD